MRPQNTMDLERAGDLVSRLGRALDTWDDNRTELRAAQAALDAKRACTDLIGLAKAVEARVDRELSDHDIETEAVFQDALGLTLGTPHLGGIE